MLFSAIIHNTRKSRSSLFIALSIISADSLLNTVGVRLFITCHSSSSCIYPFGTYYQLRIPVVFRREEEDEDARSLRLAIEMMDDKTWNEIRSKVYRTDIYTTEKFINELKDVLKKYFDVSTFWFFKDEDGHRNVAFYYKGQMVILKFYSNSMKHEVVIADTKTRLIIESMERERF